MRPMTLATVCVITLVILLAAVTLPSQAQSKTFEVVSIKPNRSVGGSVVLNPEAGGRFVASNETLRGLSRFAFFVFRPMADSQLMGGPDWVDSDRFDIQAQAARPLSFDDMSLAVRAMLEDRFQLKVHRDTWETAVYNLVVAKEGPKMKAVDAPPPADPTQASPPRPPLGPRGRGDFAPQPGMIFRGLNTVLGTAIQTEQLAGVLSSLLNRPVVDRTDLKGYFDLRLQFAPQNGRGAAGGSSVIGGAAADTAEVQDPSIFTAVQEQLGLRLESSRGPVEVIVIDSIQKPTEN